MTEIIPINLAVEDALSEAVVRKILDSSSRRYVPGRCYQRFGKAYLERSISGFNNAAKGTPFFVLIDLDRVECAPLLVSEWLPRGQHPNLIFRVAVREVEAWILASAPEIAEYFGIPTRIVPTYVDDLDDPKQCLIGLARKSRRRDIRDDIVPRPASTAKQGPNYNGRLIPFVSNNWSPHTARKNSASLAKAIEYLDAFVPKWK